MIRARYIHAAAMLIAVFILSACTSITTHTGNNRMQMKKLGIQIRNIHAYGFINTEEAVEDSKAIMTLLTHRINTNVSANDRLLIVDLVLKQRSTMKRYKDLSIITVEIHVYNPSENIRAVYIRSKKSRNKEYSYAFLYRLYRKACNTLFGGAWKI